MIYIYYRYDIHSIDTMNQLLILYFILTKSYKTMKRSTCVHVHLLTFCIIIALNNNVAKCFQILKRKGSEMITSNFFFLLVYSIPSAYVHMIWGNQNNSYNLC